MSEETVFKETLPIRARPEAAVETARIALLGQGFEILEASPLSVRARSPGLHSARHAALGASEILATATDGSATVEAKLDGQRKLKLLLYLLPAGLAVLQVPIFFVQFGWRIGLLALLPYVPWAIVAPLVARATRRRTERALKGLLRSMAIAP